MSTPTIVTIIILIFFLIFVIVGWRRGFLRMILTSLSLIATMVVAAFLLTPVSEYLADHTKIVSSIEGYVEKGLGWDEDVDLAALSAAKEKKEEKETTGSKEGNFFEQLLGSGNKETTDGKEGNFFEQLFGSGNKETQEQTTAGAENGVQDQAAIGAENGAQDEAAIGAEIDAQDGAAIGTEIGVQDETGDGNENIPDQVIDGGDANTSDIEAAVIKELKLPAIIRNFLIDNNNVGEYVKLGVNSFKQYVVKSLSLLALKVMTYVALVIVIFILIRILLLVAKALDHIPVVRGINRFFGAVLGFVEAALIIWLVCLIISLISGTDFGKQVVDVIASSKVLSFIYEQNLILRIVDSFFTLF